APFRVFGELGLTRGLMVLAWFAGWAIPRVLLRSVAAVDFHSLAPITFGPYVAKFKWVSRQDPRPVPAPGASWRNYLRAELHVRLGVGQLRYDFMAQFYRDPLKTPIDGALPWDEQDAPFVKLAELVIAPCDLDDEPAAADEAFLSGLSFSPWHGLAEH